MNVAPALRSTAPAPTPRPSATTVGNLLDSAPRAAFGVADGFVASYARSAPPLAGCLGALKCVGGFLEAAGENKALLGERHVTKGIGDFISGVGLLACAAGAGIPGVALTIGGDAMATFGRLREAYPG